MVVGVAALAACATQKGCERESDRYDPIVLRVDLERVESPPGILIGDYPLAPHAIIDGDTIKVTGLDQSLRLLALDTEETFKTNKDWELYDDLGFDGYLAAKGKETHRPVKCATPVGMDAKHFAQAFFKGITRVRLERDDPKKIRGAYGRLLAYVFVNKDGEWVNYNVEAVRAGMSPYFTKYGYSSRFHDAFVAAQEQARAAKRGIWAPDTEHYRDYDLRLAWWNARAEFLRAFEEQAQDDPSLVMLTDWDAMLRLKEREGEEVELLGGVASIKKGDGARPTRVSLSRRMFSDFPLIFFDPEVFEASKITTARGEFARIRGVVSSYTYKRRRGEGREELQIVVKRPDQVVVSKTAPSGFAVLQGGDTDDSDALDVEDTPAIERNDATLHDLADPQSPVDVDDP